MPKEISELTPREGKEVKHGRLNRFLVAHVAQVQRRAGLRMP